MTVLGTTQVVSRRQIEAAVDPAAVYDSAHTRMLCELLRNAAKEGLVIRPDTARFSSRDEMWFGGCVALELRAEGDPS